MTQRIGQGGTLRLDAVFRDGVGNAVDPTTPLVDVLNPSSVATVTDAVPVRDGVGLYHYDYAVPVTAPLGLWTAHWTGVINGSPVEDDDPFEVVAAGDVDFGDPYGITVADLEIAARRTLTTAERAAAEQLLPAVIATLERWLNRRLAPLTFTETHTIRGHGQLHPYEGPVIAIASVTIDGGTPIVTDLDDWYLEDRWPAGSQVAITYTAGKAMDAGVRQVVIDAVTRSVLVNATVASGAITSYSVEGTSITYGPVAGENGSVGRIPVADLAGIKRLKRRVVR